MPSAALEDTQVRSVPKTAARLRASVVSFAAAEPTAPNKIPIRMLARSAEPINHWYWGRIVHDLSGLVLHKDRVIVDWCHWWDEVLGYLDTFAPDQSKGLEVGGYLVSTQADDRAAEIAAKGQAGVPYEASIEFDLQGSVIEYVGDGQSVQVNGYTFAGPGYVVRKWPLMAVAVCPHGADPNTSTEFRRDRADVGEVSVQIFSKGNPMPKNAPVESGSPAASEQQLAAKDAPPNVAATDRTKFQAELKRYVEAFGAADGAAWYADGKTFEQALELQCGKLTAQLQSETQAHEATKKRLAALNLGETAALSTVTDEPTQSGAPQDRFAGKLPEGLQRFASGIKLPGRA